MTACSARLESMPREAQNFIHITPKLQNGQSQKVAKMITSSHAKVHQIPPRDLCSLHVRLWMIACSQ